MESKSKKKKPIDGATWLKYSISIWSDIKKSAREISLKHPAMFPAELPKRLIQMYLPDEGLVLDPFLGSGSTLVAAAHLNKGCIGIELIPSYAKLALDRLEEDIYIVQKYASRIKYLKNPSSPLELDPHNIYIIEGNAIFLDKYLPKESISLVITSPPYWNVHTRKRTSDRKNPRPYSDDPEDLGNIRDYEEFIEKLKEVFKKVHYVMKENAYLALNVMDIRVKNTFYPFHSDLIVKLSEIGFSIEDIFIWDRRNEYNNLKPIGYPYKFIANKVHEYILIFKKKGG